jgi:hypothetical protein
VSLLEDILIARDDGNLPLHLAVQIDQRSLASAWKHDQLGWVFEVAWLVGRYRPIYDVVLHAVRSAHEIMLGDPVVFEAEMAKGSDGRDNAIYAKELTESMLSMLSEYMGGQLRQIEMKAMVDAEYSDQYQYNDQRSGIDPYSRLAAAAYEAVFATTSRDKPMDVLNHLSWATPPGSGWFHAISVYARKTLPVPTPAEIFALFDLGEPS